MKNRLYYVLIGILLSFSFINDVLADTVVSINTNDTSVPEGTVASVKVNVKSDVALSSCLFQISSNGDITFESKTGVNGWNTSEESSAGTTVKNSVVSADLSGGINVLELKYRINGVGSVEVKTLNCVNATTGESISGINGDKEDFTATEAVEDTTLSSISVGGGNFTSSFSSDRFVYDVKLSVSNFSISYVTSDKNLSDKVVVKHNDKVINNLNNITFSGDDQGTMVIKIIVDGETTYTLNMKYQQTGLDNTLKSVTIDGENLKLEKGKYDYEYTVGKDVTSFTVKAVLNDSDNFKFNSIGNVLGTAEFSINDVVDVMIIVEPKSSESGIEHLTYNIRVKKEGSSKPVTGGTQSKPNVDTNPGTGGISMYIMMFVLIISLVGSVLLYQKNLESYK